MIRFSGHALKRAKERGVEPEQVELVIREPAEVIYVKFGRKAAFRQFGGKYIVVIYEERNNEIVVVTTLNVDRKRLIGHGFGGV
ncbi:DUF4258 domain-containing protein [Geoglobus acetivorans]|uniref:DUF4258 domain-containing protein n=1 Tax=Geoglobus acetivorans TaxID=565033 RepID=A0A0A7GH00_GEOAI|nr:hypothetical protein GACE_1187 [Geoglobus acetivorans]